MAKISCICIDFETDEILPRPDYPPLPLGFSIKYPKDRKSKYYAFDHDTGNNCSKADAKRVLRAAWADPLPKLFYNGKFDVDVAETHMGCPRLPAEQMHDAMFSIFLVNPHEIDMRLKPMAKKLLGMEPEERDAVVEWLLENKVMPRNQKAKWYRYLRKVPGNIVGTYADGDVIRTIKLFEKTYQEVVDRGMRPAYEREQKLMPILLDSERGGIRADLPKLQQDNARYSKQMIKTDNWLAKRLGVSDLNVDSDEDFAEALDNAGLVDDWVYTKTGKRSVAKGNLTTDMIKDPKVAQAYGYRNRLATCQRMFMLNWQEQAEKTGGMIYTTWNQVRQPKGGSNAQGTRTGRLSSTPNFQNLSKSWDGRDDGYAHPTFLKVDPLPLVRMYVLPDEGGVFCHRDYDQQELHILAHYEEGALLKAYRDNPSLDVHDFVRDLIYEMAGTMLERKVIKPLNFGIIYGMGAGKFALKLKKAVSEVKQILKLYHAALPGIRELMAVIKELVKEGQPIVTWGGREYFVEEPILYNGIWLDFTYKLLNYLIQGSAADCTKEAVIRYNAAKKYGRFLLTVHDEINISAPTKTHLKELLILRQCMESVEFDLKMTTTPKVGPNWAALEKIKENA